MIDTIRFKIPTTHEIYSLVKSKSKQRFVIDTTTQQLEFYISTKDIEIGSYDYHINIIATKNIEDTIFLEFSVPKVIYGHNIYLYYPTIEPVLKIVKNAMEKVFEVSFIDYDLWIIQRLDICYAWKFATQEDAYTAFLLLNPFDYSRKHKTTFDTSFNNKGSSFDFKGYIKYDEFKNHDFKRFNKLKKFDLAYDFLELSKGVFRIELTMKKKKLLSYFKKEITYQEINDTILLQKILREHFSQYLKHLDTKVMKDYEVLIKLFSTFKSSKALNLQGFHGLWFHPNPSIRARNRHTYKKRVNYTTYYRKLKDLEYAKVGIPGYDLKFDFDFSIPSPFVVNIDNAPAASAAERTI